MAKTPAERQREYMERKKQKEALASFDTYDAFKRPFFQFLGEYSSSLFEQCLAQAGIEAPEFEDDRGARHFGLNDIFEGVEEEFLSDDHGSLRRAELVVVSLLDAAADLADHIRRYKLAEIKARLAEIEASDLSEPEARKAAFKEGARLNKMLDQLDKQVRWPLPQWKVTG